MKGQKFTKCTLGKNTIGRVGVQVATELCLPKPETYTGHCWRRSCGTSASDSGVNVTTLMAMMGWSNPKTAMVYVKKSRMTSLSLSLYLANVQRSNCSNPFPRSPSEKRAALKQTQIVEPSVARSIDAFEGRSQGTEQVVQNEGVEEVGSGLKLEDSEVMLATQELLREIEDEESRGGDSFGGGVVEVVEGDSGKKGEVGCSGKKEEAKDLANIFPSVDPRLSGFLHNLQNSGSLTINFNFDSKK